LTLTGHHVKKLYAQPQLNCVLQEIFQFFEEARQAGVLLQEDVILAR
jgi:hypothetical protein